MSWLLFFLLTLLGSALLCLAYRQLALKLRIVDSPNARSSHALPTPHGGGVAILVAFVLALFMAGGTLLAPESAGGWNDAYKVMVVAALTLCGMGVVDDAVGLSVRVRLAIYALVCLGATWVLTGVFTFGLAVSPGTLVAEAAAPWALLSSFAIALAMLWLLNLYNFMDGIDGIAALETVIACSCAAGLAYYSGAGLQYVVFCLLLATAHAGFLFLNWPPAKLFMGDAGSVATGFLIGALIVHGAASQALNPLCWIILLGVFVVDATWTLMWRMLTRQPFTQPHRTHAYQRLSRHFGSHSKVDFALLAINLLWLAPLALAVVVWPQHELILVILAYLPLLAGMAKIRRFT